MADDKALRELLARLLGWGDAHVTFDAAVDGIPVKLRGKRPAAVPHSIWQLVEHLRIAQDDILDFCINPKYRETKWPDDYWPRAAAPPSSSAWTASLRRYRRDRRALQALAADRTIDLEARIPHGSGQTYLRELVLVADHGAYHVGQIVLVRRLLGIWTGA
jgi:uncharacterized damage-inducible protein DinB